ncbi:MAG: SPOR domain-containing protein [Flavobacteriaceae bacterium]|nr:SPOR domain-containing protein [Flavobacteriaceae bacterium]
MKKPLIVTFITILCLSVNYKCFSQTIVDEKIEALISKKAEYNKTTNDYYTIQIFNGEEYKAQRIENKFNEEFPEIVSTRKFEKTEWKIQVGKFRTQMKADKMLDSIKTKFRGARVTTYIDSKY